MTVFMQQMLEHQGRPILGLREPTHWMKPIRFGRTKWPAVGPPAQIRRSNSMDVMTLSNRVYPYSSISVGSYTSRPMATMMAPTSREMTSSTSS